MLAGEPGIRIVAADDHAAAAVVITDGPAERGIGRPVIVIADRADMVEAVRAGAAGVLAATVTAAQLLIAIEAVAQGLAVMPDDALADALDVLAPDDELDDADSVGDPRVALTARELDVLGLIAAGAANKVIARNLQISIHTVKFHVASILEKLDATGRTDAVAHAVRLGILML